MEDPKNLEELHNWVVDWLMESKPKLSELEANLIAEGLVNIVKEDRNIPAFMEAFRENYSKKWPLNADGDVEKEED